MHKKIGIYILGFIAQSKKFIKETFISSKHKKQGIQLSYIGFTGLCKKHFLRDDDFLFLRKEKLWFLKTKVVLFKNRGIIFIIIYNADDRQVLASCVGYLW